MLADVSRARIAQGHVLFVRRGSLMAQPFDVTSLTVTGEASGLGEPVGSNVVGGFADFSVSDAGVLAIGAAEPTMRMTTIDRSSHALATFGSQLWVLPMMGDRKPSVYLDDDVDPRDGRFSPDGRWVAYAASQPSGRQVFIRSFPDPAVKLQVSVDGGSRPVWRDDGRELFFIGQASQLMAVEVTPGPALRLGAPAPLFGTNLYNTLLTYDVYRGGQRFVMPAAEAGDQSVRVILNWLRLVKP